MFIGRLIGFLLLIVAAVVLVRDALTAYDTGRLMLMTGTQLWFSASVEDYETTTAFLHDNVALFWDLIMAPILSLPAFVTLFIFGALLIYLFRNRNKQRRRRRR